MAKAKRVGTKTQLGPDKWRLLVSSGFDAEGNRIRPDKIFHGSERQAEKALALFVSEVERGEYRKPVKMIVRDLFKKWLRTYGAFNLKDTTYETFERYLLERVSLAQIGDSEIEFGTIQVDKLSASDFYDLYNYLRNKYKYKNKTLLQIHRIMHSAFSEAMGWREINLTTHPMTGVKAPKPEEKKIVRFNKAEVYSFLRLALYHAQAWFFVYMSVDFTSGLRRGQLCGLRWMDILPESNKIRSVQNIVRVKGKGLVPQTNKNGKEVTVSVPKDTITLLQMYREKIEAIKGPQPGDALIFSISDGKPIHPDHISHCVKDFREKHNLPNITIHGGRHSYATILINDGVSLKEVSEQLGHSTTQITDKIYTEVWEERKRSVAGSLQGLIPTVLEDKPNNSNVVQLFRKAK